MDKTFKKNDEGKLEVTQPVGTAYTKEEILRKKEELLITEQEVRKQLIEVDLLLTKCDELGVQDVVAVTIDPINVIP